MGVGCISKETCKRIKQPDAAPINLAAKDVPTTSEPLELASIPSVDRIIEAVLVIRERIL